MTTAVPMAWSGLLARGGTRPARIAVIDVGSSKMCCVVARGRVGGGFEVEAKGHQLTDGLKAGEVVDAEAAEASILAVVHEAEQQLGDTLDRVVLGVQAGRPRSVLLTVELDLGGRAVADHDIARVLEHARAEVQSDRATVLHAVPVDLSLDGGRPLRDPRGMGGKRLTAVVQVVRVAAQPLANLIACVERCHLEVDGVVAAPYASAMAVLTEDEARLGALVLEMGAGVTGIALVAGGRLRHLDMVPLGGGHVTHDLAYGLQTSLAHAERMKTLFGGVLFRAGDDRERIEVPLVGDHGAGAVAEVPRARLTEISRPRVEEILALVKARLAAVPGLAERAPAQRLVVTGGASQLEGVVELAGEAFELPARLGRPSNLRSPAGVEDQPGLATVAGTLALRAGDDGGLAFRGARPQPRIKAQIQRLGQWFKENF